jgi:hypothetical protein
MLLSEVACPVHAAATVTCPKHWRKCMCCDATKTLQVYASLDDLQVLIDSVQKCMARSVSVAEPVPVPVPVSAPSLQQVKSSQVVHRHHSAAPQHAVITIDSDDDDDEVVHVAAPVSSRAIVPDLTITTSPKPAQLDAPPCFTLARPVKQLPPCSEAVLASAPWFPRPTCGLCMMDLALQNQAWASACTLPASVQAGMLNTPPFDCCVPCKLDMHSTVQLWPAWAKP